VRGVAEQEHPAATPPVGHRRPERVLLQPLPPARPSCSTPRSPRCSRNTANCWTG
jgi:hypothetical protein